MASSIPTIPPIDTPVIPNPFQKKTTKHVIQRDLIINSSIQGVQLFSLLSPIYALSKSIRTPSVSPSTLATTSTATSSVLAKAKYSRFSPTLFLRRVSIGTFLVGAGAGGTVGWLLDTVELGGADVIGRPGVGIRKGEVLIRDYSIIGGVIGAVSLPSFRPLIATISHDTYQFQN